MTCSEFQDVVREVARGLAGPVAEDALVHAGACAACQERFEEEQHLSAGMAALAASMEDLCAPPRLERRLKQAFREKLAPPARRPAVWKLLPWTVPAAAALAGALAVVWWTGKRVEPLGGADPVAVLAAKPRPVALAKTVVPAVRRPAARASVGSERPAPVLARRVKPRAVQSEDVMSFVPVRFAPPLFPGEAAEVIRVSLPGSAMHRFGVDVPPDLVVQRVNADVLLGEDGVARAVRFMR